MTLTLAAAFLTLLTAALLLEEWSWQRSHPRNDAEDRTEWTA